MVRPPGAFEDLTARSQPAAIDRVVVLAGDAMAAEGVATPRTRQPGASTLTAAPRPSGATTASPHVHERWGESRKLELSYCITAVYGDDAELEANYHTLIRSLADTTAEWERVTGANFDCGAAAPTPPNAAPVGMHWGF